MSRWDPRGGVALAIFVVGCSSGSSGGGGGAGAQGGNAGGGNFGAFGAFGGNAGAGNAAGLGGASGSGNAAGTGGTGNTAGTGGSPSCEGVCELPNPAPGFFCYCNAQCVQAGNCCPDYEAKCGGGTGGASGAGGGGTGGTGGGGNPNSCLGWCNSTQPVPGSNPSCYCDGECAGYGDCCTDYTSICGGGTGGTGGAGGTGGSGGGGIGGLGGTGGSGGGTSTGIDLRVDSNRDGSVDSVGQSDEANETTWNTSVGAVFLANIDDDENKCPKSGSDAALAACHDGANSNVDGLDDLQDLAEMRLLPWPAAPSNAAATITVTPPTAAARTRMFKRVGSNYVVVPSGATLSASELKSGLELRIEGRDILRDASWNGNLDVAVNLVAGGSGGDVVRMRMSPVLLNHHGQTATEIYATHFNSNSSAAFRADLQAACTAGGSKFTTVNENDQWTQDFFETGYMAMPKPGGAQHVVRVYFRSANFTGQLRTAGRVVYTTFRGKDRAGVTQYDPNHPNSADTLNSFGNTETIPPFSGYPLGRILRGSTPSFYPDQSFDAMLSAQGAQTPINIDTSWLTVGHVDETISFVKANTPRGWVMLVNDAALAKTMLQQAQSQGHGNTQMFAGKFWSSGSSAAVSINQVLADSNVMSESAAAVAEVNAQVAVIKAATGLTNSEIISIPFLHWKSGGYSVAYQPGTVNGVYTGDKVFAAPNPHGPVIGGVDIFKAQMQNALAPLGISVKWVEDWDLYHRLLGEVHCGSNHDRAVTTKWWESGK